MPVTSYIVVGCQPWNRRVFDETISTLPGEWHFKRRKTAESEIPELNSLQALYDFIRMLNAEGYPRPFIKYQGFRYEFSRAALYDGRIAADVTITPLKGEVQ